MIRTTRSRRPFLNIERLEPRELRADGSLVSVLAAQASSASAWATALPAAPERLIPVAPTPAIPTVVAANPTPVVSARAVTSPTNRSFLIGGSIYSVAIAGAGKVLARMGRNGLIVTAIGTDAASVLSIAQARGTHASRGVPPSIAKLTVRSGALGSLNAGSAVLNGPTSGLDGGLSTLTIGSIGRQGVLDVGPVETFTTGAVQGRVTIGGAASTVRIGSVSGAVEALGGVSSLAVGSVTGSLSVDGAVSTFQAGSVTGDVDLGATLGTATIEALNLAAGHRFHVAGNVTGGVTIGSASLAGGMVTLDRDALGMIRVNGDLRATAGGRFVVGRDAAGLMIDGALVLADGAELDGGRNFSGLTVGGDLDTSAGGRLSVAGTLGRLDVGGQVRGRLDRDIAVGLDLGALVVRGAAPGTGGIDRADFDIGKSLLGLDVTHGIFNSRITAGVMIDGGTAAGGFNAGPDGPVAVFDSIITAGVRIDHLSFFGDVKSDRATNPAGTPTRIVAGVDRAGTYSSGGIIDHFTIDGLLIDAVVAASVKPNGGNGTLTNVAGNAPGDGGFNTYDAPAGTITGSVGSPLAVGPGVGNFFTFTSPNFTAPPYDPTADPTIDDAVLPGSINASFASSIAINPTRFPSQSAATAGVISTPHGDEADHAGFFAANTRGVFVGPLPG